MNRAPINRGSVNRGPIVHQVYGRCGLLMLDLFDVVGLLNCSCLCVFDFLCVVISMMLDS